MQLIGISDCISDICNRQGCDLKKFCSFGHAIADQEFLGRTSDGVVEDLTEVASVQAAAGCDILNGNIILEILFNASLVKYSKLCACPVVERQQPSLAIHRFAVLEERVIPGNYG